MRRTFRTSPAAALTLAVAAALAACSSAAGSGGGSPSSGAPASVSVAAASAAPTQVNGQAYPVTDYVRYVGGKAGPADSSLPPVQVGWFNQSGGADDLAPEATTGAELAAKWINTYGGGIQGHPVKLVECSTAGTVAGAAQCGQQLANDSSVNVIGGGVVTVGGQALESAIAPTEKTIVFSLPGSDDDVSYNPGFIIFGDALHLEGPLATFIGQNLKAKNVAIIYQNIPGASTKAQIIADGLKILGVNSKVVAFDPTSPDLTAPLVASGAASADAIVGVVFGNYCVTLNKSLRQLNIKAPVVTNVTCVSPQIIQGDGGTLPSWYYGDVATADGDTSDPGAAVWNNTAKELGAADEASDPWVSNIFAGMMTVWKVYNQVGPNATSAQFASAMQAFKGPQLFGPPTLSCGKYPATPSVCNDEVQFYHYADGTFKRVQSFIGSPPGLTVPAS
jgi:branched-chain amino acid transport system substrate-binding protein